MENHKSFGVYPRVKQIEAEGILVDATVWVCNYNGTEKIFASEIAAQNEWEKSRVAELALLALQNYLQICENLKRGIIELLDRFTLNTNNREVLLHLLTVAEDAIEAEKKK